MNTETTTAPVNPFDTVALAEQRLSKAANAFYVSGKASALRAAFDGWREDARAARIARMLLEQQHAKLVRIVKNLVLYANDADSEWLHEREYMQMVVENARKIIDEINAS